MGKLKLTVNEEKTRIRKVPEGEFDFLGYRSGECFRRGPARPVSATVHGLPSADRLPRRCCPDWLAACSRTMRAVWTVHPVAFCRCIACGSGRDGAGPRQSFALETDTDAIPTQEGRRFTTPFGKRARAISRDLTPHNPCNQQFANRARNSVPSRQNGTSVSSFVSGNPSRPAGKSIRE